MSEQKNWEIINVMEAHNEPKYSYTSGLSAYFQHAEILVIGLPFEQAGIVIERMVGMINTGFQYKPQYTYPDILDGFDCAIIPVNKKHFFDYFDQSPELLTEHNLQFIQCVYPAGNKAYPWESDWPEELSLLQPILNS